VSEVSSDIYDTRVRENKILQRELSNMQKASSNAKEGLSKYVEKLERHFIEDTFSVAESKAVMENLLQEWYALGFFFFFFLFQSYLPAKESSVSTHTFNKLKSGFLLEQH